MYGEAGAVLVAKTANVRISPEADHLVGIAARYTGESKAEFVSRVVIEAAQQAIARGHAELERKLVGRKLEADAGPAPTPKPPPKKGR
jgi:uncharacterized protein (DUF1778 family)